MTPPLSKTAKLNGTSSGKQVGGGGNQHAVLVSGNALSSVDLHPLGYYSSMATSTDDVQQCGYGAGPLGGYHALVWSGSASSYVDLHPSGFNFSYCMGVHGGQQTGFAEQQSYFVTTSHAMVWNGTGAGGVDLHPVGYTFSRSMGVKNGEQVGYGSSVAYPYGEGTGYHTTSKAMKWNSTAVSMVSLHPLGFDASEALTTNGTQQGGWGYQALGASKLHALLWSGTPESVVDLHPVGYTDSKVTAMSDTQQVGEGWVGTVRHALLWNGTAASVVDLNQYLPAGYTNAVATGIDANGNVVGYAYNGATPYGMALPADAIAVVFAPGNAPAAAVSSISLSSANVAPGATVQVTVSLGGPAPAGGVNLSFLSTNPALVATPAAVSIPADQSSVTFPVVVGGVGMTVPTMLKLYVSDGTYSRVTAVTITPVVKLSGVNVNPVEGGFNTSGSVQLSIPAQAGGAVVTLASGNPALVTVPASVTVVPGAVVAGFTATTTSVATATAVPVTASFNGATFTTNLTLSPAPVVSLSSLTFPEVVGGQPVNGSLLLTNYPRNAGGATITLTSSDPATVQVPATVTVPQGQVYVTIPATTSAVNGLKGVSVRADYNASRATATVSVNPIPKVTILSADWSPDTKLFKVQATTTYANSTLTYGTVAEGGPLGTMQIELGVFKGSMLMDVAPTMATVWNSNGGQASMAVTIKKLATGGGGGGGGTTAAAKLTINRTGKGSVVSSPSGIACGIGSGGCSASFAGGTSVTLTAAPDPGSPFVGWTGACSGTSLTCTLTLNADTTVTANFK
ncbi:MAG: hypothetical protein NTW74_21155 [Acidobacteria bacterium]|nr:hypothetical protein [Acidobacteriota bacterium]